MQMKHFIVTHNGDASVGIPGDRAVVELDVSGFDPEDQQDYIEKVKFHLKRTFNLIWEGYNVTVIVVDGPKEFKCE